ncbi:MAG: molecular chaperone GroEL [Pseudomonadota bacterium]
MPKLLIHNNDARQALAAGVRRLAAAVEPTLGPKGMNAMVDRPVGTPLVTRDGVSIASEIELTDRFENMGAQVVREVSMQTNDVAGDGTTTSIVLANGIVQGGVELTARGAKAVDLCRGIDQAVTVVLEALRGAASPAANGAIEAVADIAATDHALGALVAKAYKSVGAEGVITAEYGVGIETTLEVVEGMSFERGYISHHLVTDQDAMVAELANPYILLTDLKLTDPAQLSTARAIAAEDGRPLLVVSEDCGPEVLASLLTADAPGKYLVVHPPEFGQWRQAMMEDLAILTGGRVIVKSLGGRLEEITRGDLGSADAVRASASETTILRGHGVPKAISARRAQVQRHYDRAPPNIEQDKLRERLAKLCGGTAVIYAGGVTPAEQKRTVQLVEDALNAVRAAMEEGVVVGGGVAFARAAGALEGPILAAEGDVQAGMRLVQSVLSRPLARIALNAGRDPNEVVGRVADLSPGEGFDAASGQFVNLRAAGIIDPLRVVSAALMNAASVAKLILTTETLIGDVPEFDDPTEGAALGGGAEKLGRQ